MSLKFGDSGDQVLALQRALQTAHFNPGNIDGQFGNGTQAAVIAFQNSEGLLADGVVGGVTATRLGLNLPPDPVSVIPGFSVTVVSQMFPVTPIGNIKVNLPVVLGALVDRNLTDKSMVLMALGTIRAETEIFLPISEGQSRFNTSPNGRPFDLYDFRRDLGNNAVGDGEKFRGRGFIQLTGRSNYTIHGAAIGLGTGLVESPERANDPDIAAKLLTSFLDSKKLQIKQALLQNDLATARRLVNGGSNGLDRFSDAFKIGSRLVPDPVSGTQQSGAAA
ncbi:MAG TPA: peptidoglycan-binding protein [Bryobacteraceae bacterium]|nr:peptidoglycan-binding protein [Bryobacteraceae bacterium]